VYAADWGHVDMVDLLLSSGVDVHRATRLGETPLHRAAYMGYPDVVRRLLQADANVTSQTDKGDTPLHSAVSGDESDIVRILLEAGSDVTIENKEGITALDRARDPEILGRLIAFAGVDFSHRQNGQNCTSQREAADWI
jgi:ankyrin repeat protein